MFHLFGGGQHYGRRKPGTEKQSRSTDNAGMLGKPMTWNLTGVTVHQYLESIFRHCVPNS